MKITSEDQIRAVGMFHVAMKNAREALTARNAALGQVQEHIAQALRGDANAEFVQCGFHCTVSERGKTEQRNVSQLLAAAMVQDAEMMRAVASARELAELVGEPAPSLIVRDDWLPAVEPEVVAQAVAKVVVDPAMSGSN